MLFFAQKNDICGKWIEEKEQSHIEIYKTKHNTYEGKIVWLSEPLNEEGKVKIDTKNPDITLRNQTIEGLVIVKNLEYLENYEWGKGNIYDARSGKTYSLNAKLKDKNTLFMRGYIGFSLIGKSTTWQRVN
tara:strand:- start:189 stop:581 length:393 start_codon:yes stop_codon:yes gene_type:complete